MAAMGLREPFNAVTHGLGLLAAVVGLVFLVLQAESATATTAYAIYGGSLVLVFLASTLYHAVPASENVYRILRRLDHSAIYVIIAGTYTPVALLAFTPGWGWTILGIVWSLAIAGIVTRNLLSEIPRWANVAIYLGLSWLVLVAIEPLLEAFGWTALTWLGLGGLLYTVGAIVYATERPDPLPDKVGFHGLWHLFVLGGSAFHYVFIAGYVPDV